VLRPASRESIEIVADDNVLPLIETRLRGSATSPTLEIRVAQGWQVDSRTPVVVTIDYVRLAALSLGGAGKISGSALKAGKLDASIGGSASISLAALDADELAVSIGGSGAFKGDGRVRKFALAIGGSGRCNAETLVASDVSVSIAGSGSARVHAETALHASIVGSGDVFYRGSPALHTSSIGNGRVHRI
jgi:Putative auto-transporter adhesin, head GIN domain